MRRAKEEKIRDGESEITDKLVLAAYRELEDERRMSQRPKKVLRDDDDNPRKAHNKGGRMPRRRRETYGDDKDDDEDHFKDRGKGSRYVTCLHSLTFGNYIYYNSGDSFTFF